MPEMNGQMAVKNIRVMEEAEVRYPATAKDHHDHRARRHEEHRRVIPIAVRCLLVQTDRYQEIAGPHPVVEPALRTTPTPRRKA